MSTVNILAVGDVCGRAGLDVLRAVLPAYKRYNGISFCVVNGENANGAGVMPAQCDEILAHGADVVTLGNHTWGARQIVPYLDECGYVLRPANTAPLATGRGWGVFDSPFGDICVVNLIGRVGMDPADCPFSEIDRILKIPEVSGCKFKLVDFHAEATSEKLALAHYLDGRVTALWGTHTHVQTNDARVLKGGTGYITDLGMTGAEDSVIGMKTEVSIARFLGNPSVRHETAEGDAALDGAVFEVDLNTGLCAGAETVKLK